LGDAMISDETWDVLAKTYDEAQLLELPILIGQYLGVAFLQNSLRVVLPEGYQGLRAR
jgi:4-carboxymuconolactone decarboxylase